MNKKTHKRTLSYHQYLVDLQIEISELHDLEIIDDFTFRRLTFPIKMVSGFMLENIPHVPSRSRLGDSK